MQVTQIKTKNKSKKIFQDSDEPCIYLDLEIVNPIYYERLSGEVSYTFCNSVVIYTCFDYELTDIKGMEHLWKILNNLPEK
jgi:hypothetical protein